MSSLDIRRANRRDFAAVTNLLVELGRPTPTPNNLEDLEEIYASYIRRDNIFALLALFEEQPAGFLSLELRYRLNYDEREAWIPDFVIGQDFAALGVEKRLFDEARRVAADWGCHQIVLESAAHQASTQRFLEDQGMQTFGKSFALKVR
ncbi:MAG: GNAT family N-acetyltransferase [Anaerolineae bacterium]|nr:GNAT family N-acetyltransferase [Anaerolineae bacterium]